MDSPQDIVEAAVDNHVKMIKEYKGVPGVKSTRLEEGYKVSEIACEKGCFAKLANYLSVDYFPVYIQRSSQYHAEHLCQYPHK